MEYAYSRGIKAHRDIKPANIMIGEDKAVKISDFGLAGVIGTTKAFTDVKISPPKIISGEAYQTMEGTAFGTPPYMPPEQFENAAGCDERSDLYSFGIVLYQMASGGKLPFHPDMSGGRDSDVFQNWYVLHSKATIPKLKSPLFPFIQKCLEKERRKRYQTFKELRADLESLLKGETGEVVKLPERKEMEAWEWNMKGASLVNVGLFLQADKCFEAVLQIDSRIAEVWNNKGLCLEELSRFDDAILCFDKAISINPNNPSFYNNKANSLGSLKKFGEAIQYIDKALSIRPDQSGYLSNKGNNYNSLGRYEEAIYFFDRALDIDPLNEGAWYDKAISLLNLGNFSIAISCCHKALEIDPVSVNTLIVQAGCYQGLKKYGEAIRCIDKALQINPNQANALHNKGLTLINLGSFDEAIQCFDKAVKLDSANLSAWYNKARLEEKLNRKKDAAQSWENFIRYSDDKNCNDVNYAKQRIEILSGKDSDNVRIAKEKLKVAESTAYGKAPHGAALNNLASVYISEGRYAEAESVYKQAISTSEKEYGPDFAQLSPFLNNLGQLYHSLGRFSEAEQCYLRAINIVEKEYGTDDQNLGYFVTNLGVLYDDMGKYLDALKLFQRALNIKERALGLSDLSVATTLEHYASSLRKIGENDKAKIMESRAREIRLEQGR